jgi:hypothetical protein
VCGKYAKQYRAGTNLVLLDPEVHKAFPTDAAVNQALRAVLTIMRKVRMTAGQPRVKKQRADSIARTRQMY